MSQETNLTWSPPNRVTGGNAPLHLAGRPVRAVLFDLDGTLYLQRRLRLLMAAELALLPFTSLSLSETRQTWKVLRTFRRVREYLRETPPSEARLAELQYTEAAARAGVSPARVEIIVKCWMYARPIKYLHFCKRPGLNELLGSLQKQGVPSGIFSDYPVEEKLSALGVAATFSVKICATDPDVNAFKPQTLGYLKACAHWGLSPEEVLYVGDRPEVDAAGARACGMPCVIVGRRSWRNKVKNGPECYACLPSFRELNRELHRDLVA